MKCCVYTLKDTIKTNKGNKASGFIFEYSQKNTLYILTYHSKVSSPYLSVSRLLIADVLLNISVGYTELLVPAQRLVKSDSVRGRVWP